MTRPRFPLRSLMAAVAVLGLVVWLGRDRATQAHVLVHAFHTPSAWALSFLMGIPLGWAVGPLDWRIWTHAFGWRVLACVSCISIYLAWADMRLGLRFLFNPLDRDWPYPDPA